MPCWDFRHVGGDNKKQGQKAEVLQAILSRDKRRSCSPDGKMQSIIGRRVRS